MIHIPDDKARKKAAKRKERLGHAVRSPKKSEMELRQMMGELWQRVLQPTADRILEMHKRGASVLEIAGEVERALHIAETQYAAVADRIVAQWMMGVSRETRSRLQRGLQASLGVDMAIVLDNEPVKTALEEAGEVAANLIKTIPNEYLGKVARAVADNYAGRPLTSGNLTNEIMRLGGVTKNRARLIARDQTSKLTAKLNEVRQTGIGIDEYIWRTSGDERVAGNPGGKYPDADDSSKFHGDHYHRNGKRFRWDDPPPDGHPGQGGFCRCWAQAVIDPAKIIARAEGKT